MPIWLIDIFAAEDLDASFLFITLMTAPFWIAMIAFPKAHYLRRVAQPWLVVPLYSLVLLVLLWRFYEVGGFSQPVPAASYAAVREFATHPIAFLLLFCNFQIINLFVGVMLYQKALRGGFRAPFELTLCWFLGALALIPFGIRLLLRRQTAP